MLHPPTQSRSGHGQRFVFVGGAPRSGTTLVQNILDCHPAIVGGPEFLHLERILKLRNALRDTAGRGWTGDYASPDEVDRQVATLIEDLLLPLADRHHCEMLSEKTPGNVFVFPELMEMFPNARFLNVVRDPRATIASMLRVGRRAMAQGVETQPFTRSARHAAAYTKRSLRAGLRAEDIAPDRLLEVRYERLVSDPAREVGRICSFLEVPFAPQMLRPAGKRHLGEKPITEGSGNLWYDLDSYRRNPDPSGLDKWRNQLGVLQRGIIALIFADFEHADRLRYPLVPKKISGVMRVARHAYLALRSARRMLGQHSLFGYAGLVFVS